MSYAMNPYRSELLTPAERRACDLLGRRDVRRALYKRHNDAGNGFAFGNSNTTMADVDGLVANRIRERGDVLCSPWRVDMPNADVTAFFELSTRTWILISDANGPWAVRVTLKDIEEAA